MKKKVTRKKKSTIKKSEIFSEVWPQERDYMARPERIRYVRKIIPIKGCVFCAARDKGVSAESLCLFKNEHAMVILNKFPYNSGHIMVLPTRHCGDLTELTQQEQEAIHQLLMRTVAIVKKEYRFEGLNIGLNMGSVAGAGLPNHLHWHIIPRWHGDTNFFPIIAETKLTVETVEQSYARYVRNFQKGK